MTKTSVLSRNQRLDRSLASSSELEKGLETAVHKSAENLQKKIAKLLKINKENELTKMLDGQA